MFDLHCHILPGIDDGAASWDESLEMARISLAEGVKTLVATPHYTPTVEPGLILALVEEFKFLLKSQGLNLTVYPGMEASLDPDLPKLLKDGRILTVSRHVLVELPFSALPLYTEDVLFQIMLAGYNVILAHPERNNQVIQKPELVFEWVSRGILVQINSGSLLGKFGPAVKAATEVLLKAKLVHFIGSDAHSSTQRRPNLGDAASELRRLSLNARDISDVNGHLLLLGKFNPSEDFERPLGARMRWWHRLWGN